MVPKIRHPDVIVMGVGRTGTSFVANVLHHRLNICMGHRFVGRNKFSYECRDMWDATVKTIDMPNRMDLYPKNYGHPMDSWLGSFYRIHKDCGHQLCGVKCTHFSLLTAEQLLAIDPRLIVRTWRNLPDTVESMLRVRVKRTKDKAFWTEFYKVREQALIDLELELDGKLKFIWIHIPDKTSPRLQGYTIGDMLRPYLYRIKKYGRLHP